MSWHSSMFYGEPAGLIACLTDSDSSERWLCCSFHGWQAQAHSCRHTLRSQSMDKNRLWMPSNYHQWMALWDRQALPCACLCLITHIFHFSPISTLNFRSLPLLKYAILSVLFLWTKSIRFTAALVALVKDYFLQMWLLSVISHDYLYYQETIAMLLQLLMCSQQISPNVVWYCMIRKIWNNGLQCGISVVWFQLQLSGWNPEAQIYFETWNVILNEWDHYHPTPILACKCLSWNKTS